MSGPRARSKPGRDGRFVMFMAAVYAVGMRLANITSLVFRRWFGRQGKPKEDFDKKSTKASKSVWVALVFWEVHGSMPTNWGTTCPAEAPGQGAKAGSKECWISLVFWRRLTR